jgi:hypothetical protein
MDIADALAAGARARCLACGETAWFVRQEPATPAPTTHERSLDAFDAIMVAAYFGPKFRHLLMTNPAALQAAETLAAALRADANLGTLIARDPS